MTANTTLNTGSGGDVIRTIDRSGTGPKTQVVQLDIGGGGATETLVSGALPVKTQDGAGNVINSLSAGTNMNGIMVAIGATNYVISTVNSSSAQLAAGATFTGTIESGSSEPAVSVIITCDQPGILTLNQYITSSAGSIINSVSYNTPATTGGNCFARSFTLNGNFFNLTFKNNGASTTTTLQIDTAFGNIPATTNLLNGPVSLNEVNGTALSLGQGTMAASLPVAIASNQSAVPVSGTVTANISGSISNTSFAATQATPASLQMTATQALGTAGTRWFAQLSDGTNSPAVKAASTAAAATDPALTVAISPNNSVVVTQATAANLNATVTQQAITKGTQGSTGVTTQDLKDAGRVSKCFTVSALAATATTETGPVTYTISSGLAATTTGTTYTVTTGKTLRIQQIIVSARNSTGTTASPATFRIRAATSGAITTSSPLQAVVVAGTPASAQSTYALANIPDGLEFASASTLGFTIQQSNWVTASVVCTFDVTVIGYEY